MHRYRYPRPPESGGYAGILSGRIRRFAVREIETDYLLPVNQGEIRRLFSRTDPAAPRNYQYKTA